MRTFAVKSMLCLLLGTAFLSTWHFVRNAPAYTETLRTRTIYGEERLPRAGAMYDRGAYALEVAHTYIYGSVNVFAEQSLAGAGESIISNAKVAEALIVESLRADPANANAWHLLARARSLQGLSVAEIVAPLRNSWGLAPNNLDLARQRLELVGTLIDFHEVTKDLKPDSAAISRDIATLRRFFPSELNDLISLSQGLARLIPET
jgi:hypothetical protein